MTLNPGREAIGAAAQAAENFAGLNPVLQKQAMALVKASNGRVYLKSGYRSPKAQQAAYDAAVKQYGPDHANKIVADPQASNHVQGLAVDFGGDLQVMNQLAPQFGLSAPMGWEPWHFEFPSTTHASHPAAYTISPQGEPNPTQRTDHTPASMAASIAESLLSLQHRDSLGLGAFSQPISGGDAQGGTGDTGSIDGGSYTPGGGAFGGVPQQQWASDFLTKLGKPVTPENMRFVTAWEAAESGGGGGHFNPLNTTQGGFAGETNLNSVGVKNYTSYDDGIAANVKVINNGRYQPILDALDKGDNAMAAAQAVAQTPWGSGEGVMRVLNSG
jgi:hypothetical protein